MITAQVEPRRSGIVNRLDVPLGRYLGAAWDAGVQESAFSSISQMTEDHIYGEGRRITAEEANRKYSVPGLNFQEPTYEAVARMRRDRHQRRLDRETLMESAETFSGRWWGGLGVGVLSSFTNPLDFALNFMPVVGSEKYAKASAIMGRGTFRTALARGLVTEEALAASRVPFPRLTGAMIEGAVGQAIAEVPIAMAKELNLEQHPELDSFLNIAAGSVLGGALHLGVTSMARLFRHLSPETKKVLMEQAAEQFLTGQDFKLHQFVEIDEARIRERVAFDVTQARAEGALNINEREIRRIVREKFDDEVVAPAIKFEDGTVKIGAAHFLIEGSGNPGAEAGFLTAKGRFITREEAFQMLPEERQEKLISEDRDPELVSEDLEPFDRDAEAEFLLEARYSLLGGPGSKELNAKLNRDMRMREEAFFARPDVRELVESERQRRISEFVEARKREHDPEKAFNDEVLAEIDRQKELGKVLTPEQVRKYGFERNELERTATAIKEDVQELEKELGIQEQESSSADASKGSEQLRKAPDLEWGVTVTRGIEVRPGESTPGYVQIDFHTGPESGWWSSNPEKLQAEGFNIPSSKEFLKSLDTGKYSFEQALFMMDKKPALRPEEQALLDAVGDPETRAIDVAADCLRRNIL